jgi:hypothetical protein
MHLSLDAIKQGAQGARAGCGSVLARMGFIWVLGGGGGGRWQGPAKDDKEGGGGCRVTGPQGEGKGGRGRWRLTGKSTGWVDGVCRGAEGVGGWVEGGAPAGARGEGQEWWGGWVGGWELGGGCRCAHVAHKMTGSAWTEV